MSSGFLACCSLARGPGPLWYPHHNSCDRLLYRHFLYWDCRASGVSVRRPRSRLLAACGSHDKKEAFLSGIICGTSPQWDALEHCAGLCSVCASVHVCVCEEQTVDLWVSSSCLMILFLEGHWQRLEMFWAITPRVGDH